MNASVRVIGRCLLWVLLGLVGLPVASAGPIVFQATGLGAAGTQATFALDFIDGDGPSNSITAHAFTSNGTLALQSQSGSVSGNLSTGLQFLDSAFFSEALLLSTGASSVGFAFDATQIAPATGAFADAFSIFLLDALTGQSLVETSDPSGANALLLFVIDGSGGHLQVFNQISDLDLAWAAAPGADGGSAVPEPASLALGLIALTAMGLVLRGGRYWRAAGLGASMLLGVGMAQAEDLTSKVDIARSGFVLNRVTGTYDTQVTLTNRSGDTVLGPLRLVLASVTPANVALYNSAGRTAAYADFVDVPLSAGTLANGASAIATVRLLAYGQAIGPVTFAVEGQRLTAANTTQLQLSGLFAAGVVAPQPTPVGSGYVVKVDGVRRGVTDGEGKLTVAVAVGAKTVQISKSPNEGGSTTLPTLQPGATAAVTVLLDDGKEISADSVLRFDQLQQGLLSRAAARISLRFLEGEQPVRLVSLSAVNLIDTAGNYLPLTPLFTLQSDGSLSLAPAAFYPLLGASAGRRRLEISGEDAAGQVHVGTIAFYLSDYRVRVQLVAPPSAPGLPLAGVRLVASILNTDLRFNVQSDANGYVTLPDLPPGNLSLSGSTASAGTTYGGAGTAAINKNTLVKLTLRGPQDVLNNVPPIVVLPLPAGQAKGAGDGVASADPVSRPYFSAAQLEARAQLDRQRGAGAAPRAFAGPHAAGDASVTVTAIGGAQDALSQNSAPLTVKKGIKKAVLRYTVSTAEYPQYVLQQSIYNDVWSVSVLAGTGVPLYEITRQINSQLSQEPVWHANGSTGEIKQEIDVSALTVAADATLIVRATSVNIGDGVLPTAVSATLESSDPLLIGDITAEALAGANNNGSYYSIPRPGASNTLARNFTLQLTKPTGSTLTAVRVELRNGAGAPLMTVLQDAAPGTADVVVQEQTDTSATLTVRATISNPASTVASVPPSTRDLTYHFTVKAKSDSGVDLSDEKDANGKRALWRMPDALPRYGTRDNGGDDWAARGTYEWLVANAALLREIDDVSGEHGRDIGHATHALGTDIDAYHFYRFPGAVSGTQNHTLLTADLVLAFQTLPPIPAPPTPVPPPAPATAAFNRVAAWLQATRTGLTNLAALGSVSQLIHCSGVAAQGLPAGWCSTLLQTGSVSRTVPGPSGAQTQTLAFGGTFSSAKMTYRNDHNNHIHITLNPTQIGE